MPQNKEYIEREEALRQIFLEAMGHDFDFNAEYRKIYISARRAIKNTPAADVVEVRHGQMIEGECTVCGWHGDCVDTPYYNYCPNCGCKMDKEE